jgi:Fe-S cluster assembly protein SufD
VFASHSLSFGARLARNDIRTRFDGEGCETLFNGLYHVDGRRHVDHQTRRSTMPSRAAPAASSTAAARRHRSRGVFAGRIVVAQDAQRSDAMQRCDNLLLSRQAEADARPELEIYADDVKCAHGATVGQIDDESLFYLRSRGLDETHARQLLTYAFAAEALARIDLVPLRKRAGRPCSRACPAARCWRNCCERDTPCRARLAPEPAGRGDFPILSRPVHGRRLAYLDNGATTQKPDR